MNVSAFLELMFLSSTGSRLKILAPLTPKKFSLAFLTWAGELITTALGRAVLPLRPSWLVNWTSYPLTWPWEIFHRNNIIYDLYASPGNTSSTFPRNPYCSEVLFLRKNASGQPQYGWWSPGPLETRTDCRYLVLVAQVFPNSFHFGKASPPECS